MATSAPRRRGFHFIPYAPKRSDQVCANVGALVFAVLPWVQRMNEAAAQLIPALQDADEIRVHIAGALMRAAEWDGFMLCHELCVVSAWPADAELVQIIHRWSCDLRSREIESWKARKDASRHGA